MCWLLLAPATAYIRHQCVLDLSVGQNHLETITKTSTESVSPGFNFHNGTQETILEFPVAIVLLAWGSCQHPQPGKEFYNTSFSFFQRGACSHPTITELQLFLLVLNVSTAIFYQIKCRGFS